MHSQFSNLKITQLPNFPFTKSFRFVCIHEIRGCAVRSRRPISVRLYNDSSPILRRRDGRVAEGARLESVFRGNSNVGSNPTLSAIKFSRFTDFAGKPFSLVFNES